MVHDSNTRGVKLKFQLIYVTHLKNNKFLILHNHFTNSFDSFPFKLHFIQQN